jgi:capsular polysaccharide transport system permease protein
MGGVDMSQVISAYLTSSDLLEKLDQSLHLREYYSNPNIDWWDRLSKDASAEKFLAYFQSRTSVRVDMGGYLTVDVQAFDPKMAQTIAQAMADGADKMVGAMSDRARRDTIGVAQKELSRAQDKLREATLDVTNFQNAHHDFNPTEAAAQFDTIIGALNTQLAQARSDLTNARTFLNDKAPSVISLKSKINALEKQIQVEKSRLASTEGTNVEANDTPYSKRVADYTRLLLEQSFAKDGYVSAKSAFDVARTNAERKEGYAVTFVLPNLPQAPTEPDPLTYILSAFLISLIGYAIISLLVGSFRDQAGI